MNHVLKIQEQFADAVCRCKKTFEVRREDGRRFEVGDRIAFRVIDEGGRYVPSHALNRMSFRVTYVLHGWGVEDGYAAIAIKPVEYASLDKAACRTAEWGNAPALALGV